MDNELNQETMWSRRAKIARIITALACPSMNWTLNMGSCFPLECKFCPNFISMASLSLSYPLWMMEGKWLLIATVDGHFPPGPNFASSLISKCHGCMYTFLRVVTGTLVRTWGPCGALDATRCATAGTLKKSSITSSCQGNHVFFW